MRLSLLADLLEAAQIGVKPEAIYIDEMPATETIGVLLRLPLTGVPINHELPGYYRSQVQAIVRAQKAANGDLLAARVSAALTLTDRSLPAGGPESMFVTFLRPRTLPVVYPRSDGNGKEWSISLDACYVMR